MWSLAVLLSCALLAGQASAFIGPPRRPQRPPFTGDAGPRLLLTPHIRAGNIRQAREFSLVTGLEPNITSYAGFFTVDEDCGSNLFFWFFPSQNDWINDPVSLWLNGGPGSSSLFGLLTENGPYDLSLDGELSLREYSWNRNSSVIYVDSPVGTGFSYTGRDECFAEDQEQVGRDLVNALEQFMVMFPELSDNPFYLTGESYAGKYIPAVAYTIYKNNSPLNLHGLAIGNGFTDPINQGNYADYLYQLGFIDSAMKTEMLELQDTIIGLIEMEKYAEANGATSILFQSVADNAGVYSLYNYLFEMGAPEADIDSFLDSQKVREALHVGNETWKNGGDVYDHLNADVMKSVKPWMEELLNNTSYRVVLYNGQLDIICAYPLALDYINTLNWPGAADYQTAPRNIWRVGDRVAGYSKSSGLFTEVLVRNAGHMVPTDQPEWALDLYNRIVHDQTL